MRKTVSLLMMWTGIAIAMYGVRMPIGWVVIVLTGLYIQGAIGEPWYVRQTTTIRQC